MVDAAGREIDRDVGGGIGRATAGMGVCRHRRRQRAGQPQRPEQPAPPRVPAARRGQRLPVRGGGGGGGGARSWQALPRGCLRQPDVDREARLPPVRSTPGLPAFQRPPRGSPAPRPLGGIEPNHSRQRLSIPRPRVTRSAPARAARRRPDGRTALGTGSARSRAFRSSPVCAIAPSTDTPVRRRRTGPGQEDGRSRQALSSMAL